MRYGPAVAGSSQLVNLVINGQSTAVTGQPNQKIFLPNGTLLINEQISSSISNTAGRLIVNVLHITTSDIVTGQQLANVVLASADAKVQCQSGSASNSYGQKLFDTVFAQSEPANFASGGGWILAPDGSKGTFGVFGGLREDGSFTGHVVYIDHGIDLRVKSTVTKFAASGCQSEISSEGESNGQPATIDVTLTDGSEPGESDIFTIKVSGGGTVFYTAGGMLGGGNLQAHGQPCP
jgi:hypothetical protein